MAMASQPLKLGSFGGRTSFLSEHTRARNSENEIFHVKTSVWESAEAPFRSDGAIIDPQTLISGFESGAALAFHALFALLFWRFPWHLAMILTDPQICRKSRRQHDASRCPTLHLPQTAALPGGGAMIATGIDLGGTKIEVQVFDHKWACAAKRRVDTPTDYAGIVAAIVDQIRWADAQAGRDLPVGVGAAGLVNPRTGLAYSANLPTTGLPLPRDIEATLGRSISHINDCRALALSEAVFGAGRGKNPVAALVLGTGVGGGVAIDGRLAPAFSATGGEFGHFTASAQVIAAHDLPILRCGCGRWGCTETLVSGPGLMRVTEHIAGQAISPADIASTRAANPLADKAWRIWCDLVADLLITLVFTTDPEAVVIGGGVSKIPGLIGDLTEALARAQLPGFATPELLLAEGGEASGARGAAYAAVQAQAVA